MRKPYFEHKPAYKHMGLFHITPTIYTVNNSDFFGVYFAFLTHSVAIFFDKR